MRRGILEVPFSASASEENGGYYAVFARRAQGALTCVSLLHHHARPADGILVSQPRQIYLRRRRRFLWGLERTQALALEAGNGVNASGGLVSLGPLRFQYLLCQLYARVCTPDEDELGEIYGRMRVSLCGFLPRL